MLWRHSCTQRVPCADSLLEWCIYLPRNAGGCRLARMNYPTPPRGTMALPTPSKTCCLQNPDSTFLSLKVCYDIHVGQTTSLSVQWSPPLVASLIQMVEDNPDGIIQYDGKRAGWEGRPAVRHTCWFFCPECSRLSFAVTAARWLSYHSSPLSFSPFEGGWRDGKGA